MRPIFTLLMLFSLAGTALADNLTLTFARSPLGINWSTPHGLALSTVKNSLYPTKIRAFAISHVFVSLKCDSLGYERHTGMTSATSTEERELLFKKAYGFGVMFHTYQGELESTATVLKDLADHTGSKRIAKLSLEINEATCARLKQYLEEYEARGFGSMYSGLQARPRKGEGSGCAAFGMSFLELAGLLSPEWNEAFMRKLHVPKRLVGGPLTGQRVPFLKVISNIFATWNPNREHIYLEAYDPESMYRWVRQTHQEVRLGTKAHDVNWQISNVGKTRILSADMTHVPTPTDPIWQY